MAFGRGDRGDQRAETHVDEVNVGGRKSDVARQHNSAVEQPIEEVNQCDVLLPTRSVALDHGITIAVVETKLYGGQGPVNSSAKPSSPHWSRSVLTVSSNSCSRSR